jgi:hypothetical protein
MAKNQFFEDKNYREYGDDYIRIIAKLLMGAGKRASGKLIKSLSDRVQDDARKVNLIIESEDYFEQVDEGRKPGSYPPIKAIEKWAKLKGINQKSVFPIAKKIYRFGIKPTNIIDKSIKQFEPRLIQKIEDDVTEKVENDTYNDIVKKFKKLE